MDAIGKLEGQLGLALFDRSGHRPTLTPEGRALLADARAILLKVDSLRARARGMGEGVELGLSIVVDTLFPVATVGAALSISTGSLSNSPESVCAAGLEGESFAAILKI